MSDTHTHNQPDQTVEARVERVVAWLTANRPDIMVGLLLDRGLANSVDECAELLLVNPVHEHLLKPNWRMGIFHVAAIPPSLASANLRLGINTTWVPDVDCCEKTLQDWNW